MSRADLEADALACFHQAVAAVEPTRLVEAQLAERPLVAPKGAGTAIVVWNKTDLGWPGGVGAGVSVSAETGEGLDGLLEALEDAVRSLYGNWESPAVSRTRHREALVECLMALRRGSAGVSGELLAEDVRVAVASLGRLLGRVDLDRVLDGVFAEFCIGK